MARVGSSTEPWEPSARAVWQDSRNRARSRSPVRRPNHHTMLDHWNVGWSAGWRAGSNAGWTAAWSSLAATTGARTTGARTTGAGHSSRIVARVVANCPISGITSSTYSITPDTPLGRVTTTWQVYQQVTPEEVIFERQGLEIRPDMSVASHGLWPCPTCGEVVIFAVPRRPDGGGDPPPTIAYE